MNDKDKHKYQVTAHSLERGKVLVEECLTMFYEMCNWTRSQELSLGDMGRLS